MLEGIGVESFEIMRMNSVMYFEDGMGEDVGMMEVMRGRGILLIL